MISAQQLVCVVSFELREALRSKLVVLVVGFLAAGSALGAIGFIKAFQAAEHHARRVIAQGSGIPPDRVPMEEVKSRAIEGLISLQKDESVTRTLVEMQPLAIFYGYVVLLVVPLLVLTLSGATHAADLQTGTARFSLLRCTRWTWALGKTLGHALLLGVGLLVGGLVAGFCGVYFQADFELHTWGDLLVAAGRAWIYGWAYLGIFSGVSLLASSPITARALGLFSLIFCGLGHAVATSQWLAREAPTLTHVQWLFPGQYELGLWSSSVAANVGSALGLLVIGGGVFWVGTSVFDRRDA